MRPVATLVPNTDDAADAADRLRDLGLSLPPPEPLSTTPLPTRLVRTLWVRMIEMYGHRFKVHFGETADSGAGETWSKALAGLTGVDLARGLEACLLIDDDWPPSAPRFRALCLGIPVLDEVREDLQREHAQRQPFTRLVWRFLDGYAWRRAEARDGARMLEAAYARAKRHRMKGYPLPLAAVELAPATPRPPTPADPAKVAAAIDEARRVLGPAQPEPDEAEGELEDPGND